MIRIINHRREIALPGLWHDFANLFPMLDAAAQDRLREDVQTHGVREPVIVYAGRILDGRNRYMAARDLDLDFPVADFDGTPQEALAYVLSTNLHRRHLTESQRAAVASKVANMGHGDTSRFAQDANLHLGVTSAQAAEMLNVSQRSVAAARKVHEHGDAMLFEAVERGEVAVSAAAVVADLPRGEQAAVVAAGPKAVREKAKAMREAKAVPEPPAEPMDPAEAKLRRDLAKLTPEALIDDVVGLRAQIAEERARRRKVEAERDDLKDQIAALTAEGDMGRKLGIALQEIQKVKGRLGEVQAQLARETRRANAMEKARDELQRRIEAQIIPMDGAA
jgi:hypothetical protein